MIPSAKRFAKKTETHIKGFLSPGAIFEELGFQYIGPLDGHNLKDLTRTLKNINDLSGPVFLHLVTKKGKGFTPAEENPIKFHALPKSQSVPNKNKGPKYIPLARRGDKPDAIAWIVKNHPEVKNNQISKLIGTTKDTIEKIRTRSHWNISNITAKHPVLLSLCTQEDLDEAIIKAGGSLDTVNDESIPANN